MVFHPASSLIKDLFLPCYFGMCLHHNCEFNLSSQLCSNGQTEHINQCVEQYLPNFCSYQQDDWVDWIGLAEFQYNNLIHKTTQVTPFYANYGFHPSFSVTPLQKSVPPLPTITDFIAHLDSICSGLQAELKIAQQT